jgi:hypothetical protein
LDRCGTGIGEKPCRIHAIVASREVISIRACSAKKKEAQLQAGVPLRKLPVSRLVVLGFSAKSPTGLFRTSVLTSRADWPSAIFGQKPTSYKPSSKGVMNGFKTGPRNQNSHLINTFQEEQKETNESLLPNCSNCSRFLASCAASSSLQLRGCDKAVTHARTRRSTDFPHVFAVQRSWACDRSRRTTRTLAGTARMRPLGSNPNGPPAGCFTLICLVRDF